MGRSQAEDKREGDTLKASACLVKEMVSAAPENIINMQWP